MSIVPKQVQVDEAVITYWLKKLRWKDEEFAALCCGINPIAYEAFTLSFIKNVDFEIEPHKVEKIEDIRRLIHDRFEFIERLPAPPSHWKAIANKIELTLPEWFSRVLDVSPTSRVIHQSEAESTKQKIPTGVATSDIAAAFDGLKWSESQWKHHLGDPPVWLKSCQLSKGLVGRQEGGVWIESRWNPVSIASVLANKGTPTRRLSKAFKSFPAMEKWSEIWEEYKDTHHPSDSL